MAYLARIEANEAQPLGFAAPPPEMKDANGFSELEWSIVRLAHKDALWTARPRGLFRRFLNWAQGRGNPELANEGLEAVRRMAVLSWHFGSAIDPRDVDQFLAAGFTKRHFELLVSNIVAQRPSQSRPISGEALA